MRVGRSLAAADGRYAHLAKLLGREAPLGGERVQCDGLEHLRGFRAHAALPRIAL
jgi:hypothetical protein